MTPETRKNLFVEYVVSLSRTETTAMTYAKRLENMAAVKFPELFEGLGFKNLFETTDAALVAKLGKTLHEERFAERNKADGHSATRAALGLYAKYLESNVATVDEVYLYQKPVDKSLLCDGFTIPKDQVNSLFSITGLMVGRGEKRQIEIQMLGRTHLATLTAIDHSDKYADRSIVQVRYSKSSSIAEALNDVFSYTARQVAQIQGEGAAGSSKEGVAGGQSKKRHIISDQEHIDIYVTQDGRLVFKCFPVTSAKEAGNVDDELHLMMQEPEDAGDREEAPIDNASVLQTVKRHIASRGFIYPEGLIENYYLSLKSKPFVILAGASGTGKTRLVRLFAEAVGATVQNGRYKMVTVRPDWSDSSDLIGHVGLDGTFVAGPVIDFIKQAADNPTRPYFLCLDEMNLARVEYYLSDFLSVVETREWAGKTGRIITADLASRQCYGKDQDALENYGVLGLPDNLYVVGTVNMDETTFPFSKKVLDRANTLEFDEIDLQAMPWNAPHQDEGSQSALEVPNSFLRSKYLTLLDTVESTQLVEQYCEQLARLNAVLKPAGLHVGYRVRDEIVFYLLENHASGLMSEAEALDNLIMQKILPRVQGSGSQLKRALGELFILCGGDFTRYQTSDSDVSSAMYEVIEAGAPRHGRSAAKIAFMVGRLEADGFTSYWL